MKFVYTSLFVIVGLAAIAQDSFTDLNGIPGGRIKSIQFDANGKAYIVNTFDSKIYASTDTMWSKFGSATALVSDLLIDGTDFYYADYSTLFKSTNNGVSWSKISGNSSFKNTDRLFKLPVGNTFVVYGGCEGVYVSSDGGVNWVNITGNTSCNSSSYQTAYTSNGDIYYIDPNVGILRHTFPSDGIWSPTKVTTVFPKQTSGLDYTLSVFVNRQASNKVFITHTNSAGTQQLIKTSPSGNAGSFTALTGPSTSFNSPVWSVSTSNKVYLFASGGFWELTNETTPTWTTKTVPNSAYSDYNVLSFAWKSATEVYAGIDGSGIFRSTNAGASWSNFNGSGSTGLISPWGADIELTNSTIVVKEDNGTKGVWTSSNQGLSFAWRPQSFTLYGGRPGQLMAKLQDNSIISGSSAGTRRTTDGVTWTQQNGTSYVIYLPVGSNEIVGISDGNSGAPVGRSTNLGVTWTNQSITGLPTDWYPMYAVAASGNYFISLNNNTNGQTEYWKLNTSGSPWVATKLTVPLTTNSWASFGFFELNNKLYAGDREKIAISSDQGATWNVIQYPHEWVMPIRQNSGGIGLGSRGSLVITQDDGINWRSISLPNTEAVVKDITKDLTNNFYAVCQGGPVVKFTGNLILLASELPPPLNFTWQPLSGPSGGQVIRLFKNSSDQIFAVAADALLKNNTTTAAWDRISVPNHFYGFSDVIIDNANKIYAIDSYQLLHSSNNGGTWTLATGNISDARKIMKASNSNLIISTGNGLLLSTNDGNSFSNPVTASTGNFTAIGRSSTGTLMAAKVDGATASLLRSTDNGATWTSVSGVDLSGSKQVLSISALEAGAIAVVTTDNIYKSTDGGTTWSSIKGNLTTIYNVNDEYWKSLAKIYVGAGNNYYFSNQISLYSSSDNGTTWTKKSDTPSSFHDVIFVNGKIYAGTAIEGVLESSDGGVTFTKYLNNKNLHGFFYNGLEIKNSKLFAISSYGRLFSSTDNGNNFLLENADNVYTDYLTKFEDGNVVAFGGGIAKSNDGIAWSNLQADPGYYIRIVYSEGQYYGYRDLNGNLQFLKSTDLTTWQPQSITNIPSSINIETIAVNNSNIYFTGYNSSSGRAELYRVAFGDAVRIDEVPNAASVESYNSKLFAYSSTGNIYESSDGTTWVRRSAPAEGAKLMITGNVYFFISNERTGDLWLSRDEGKSWQNVGGAAYKADLFTNIRVDQATGIAYALAQNNPVLKSSTIIPDLKAPAVSSKLPAHASTTVSPVNFTIGLTFNERVVGVAGKKIRLIDSDNPGTPVQIWDAPIGVLTNENRTATFTPTAAIGYLKNYFIIVDQGAFTDIFGNAYVGLTANNSWIFSTPEAPDALPPTITLITSDFSITKGDSKQLDVKVSDDKNVPSNTTFIYYRKIGSSKSSNFTKQQMDEITTTGATSKNFKVTVLPAWYDDMGLEYYFETTDGIGKVGTLKAAGDKYFYSYVKFSNESSAPKVAGIGFGRAESNYRIISVPHSLANTQIATQFDELGPVDKASWRLLSYNGSESYDEYPGSLNSLTRGVGYWIISRDVRDVYLQDAEAPINNRDELFGLNLRQGWNLIGNPYTIAIDWADTKAGNSAVGDLNKFVNGIYSKVNTLGPFEGGFVYASQPVTGLKVQFLGGSTGGRAQTTGADLASEKWEVPIMIYQGDRGNEVAAIGMNNAASEGFDHFDEFNPPSLLTAVELNFKNNQGNPLAKSIVRLQNNHVWEFTARAESMGNARIKWDPSLFGDNDKELFLFDLANQQKVNMRTQNEYTFSGKTRNFKIYFGEAAESNIKPSLTTLGDPYPNPSHGKVIVPFTIEDTAHKTDVVIEIFNSVGQRIKSIAQSNYESGFHAVEWTHDISNHGIYYCRMVSRTESGSITSQTKKIIIQ